MRPAKEGEVTIKPGGGALGGVTPGARSALQFLQRQVERSGALTEAEVTANIRFAVEVRDDPMASHRDRLRAMELLESMRARGIDVAMYLDKMDRIDDGKATDANAVEVRFVNRMGGDDATD